MIQIRIGIGRTPAFSPLIRPGRARRRWREDCVCNQKCTGYVGTHGHRLGNAALRYQHSAASFRAAAREKYLDIGNGEACCVDA